MGNWGLHWPNSSSNFWFQSFYFLNDKWGWLNVFKSLKSKLSSVILWRGKLKLIHRIMTYYRRIYDFLICYQKCIWLNLSCLDMVWKNNALIQLITYIYYRLLMNFWTCYDILACAFEPWNNDKYEKELIWKHDSSAEER